MHLSNSRNMTKELKNHHVGGFFVSEKRPFYRARIRNSAYGLKNKKIIIGFFVIVDLKKRLTHCRVSPVEFRNVSI